MQNKSWEECCHHHHGCACREHTWEVRVAGLEAEVTRLSNLADHLEEESGQRDCAALEAEVTRLKAELEAQRDDYAARYEFMVKRSCDERLDGYRELGHKCAQLEEERDKALAEVKRLNSLLAANRLLTRAAIHNMFLSSDPGAQIAKIIEEQEKKDEPTAAQEREAIVARLRYMIRECHADYGI